MQPAASSRRRPVTGRQLAAACVLLDRPGFTTELMHLYLATGLTAIRDRIGEDEDERLELVRLPFEEALARADSGEIDDAKSLVALYRLARLRAAGEA